MPSAAAWHVLVVLVVSVVVLVEVVGGWDGAGTVLAVRRTTESRAAPLLPSPPIRYPEPPTVAAAAFDTGDGSVPAARTAWVPGSKETMRSVAAPPTVPPST